MPYILNQSDIHGLAQSLGIQTVKKGDELFFRHCPYCQGGAQHDKETFSVNLETGLFKCFRSSCGAQGHFVKLARDNGYKLDMGDDDRRKTYRALPQKPKPAPTSPAVAYLESRGISAATAEIYGITTQKEHSNILVFPFYDGDGVLRYVKYRKTDFDRSRDKNKEWCEGDAMPILFGMNCCTGSGSLVITEGQLDSLSLAEAGIPNAVSVPNGAMGMTWIENCWDWLMGYSEIVIFGDNEHGAITLVDRIAERIPKPIRVVQREDYYGEKDANDILRRYGKQPLIEAVVNARELVTQHVKELADVKPVDIAELPRIYTKVPEIDRIIGGMFYGQVILLTGKRGEGKSTFMSQIIADALEQDIRTLAYSGELPDYHFKLWLDMQLAGAANLEKFTNQYGDEVYRLPEHTARRISEWYRGRMYLYDNNAIADDESECTELLDTIELAIQRHGIRFVCLDNLMTALDVELDKDIYRAQSKFLKRLKRIAVRYNVVILLVAHPKKTKDAVEIEDISGSGDISNRVDVVMAYSRGDGEGTGSVRIFKNRLTGKKTTGDGIALRYSASSKQITSFGSGRKSYSWEAAPAAKESGDLPF